MLYLDTERPIRLPNSIDFCPIDMVTNGADSKETVKRNGLGTLG